MADFARNLKRLSRQAQGPLIVENDDKIFTPADLLPVCRATGSPLVYDVHHNLHTDQATDASFVLRAGHVQFFVAFFLRPQSPATLELAGVRIVSGGEAERLWHTTCKRYRAEFIAVQLTWHRLGCSQLVAPSTPLMTGGQTHA